MTDDSHLQFPYVPDLEVRESVAATLNQFADDPEHYRFALMTFVADSIERLAGMNNVPMLAEMLGMARGYAATGRMSGGFTDPREEYLADVVLNLFKEQKA